MPKTEDLFIPDAEAISDNNEKSRLLSSITALKIQQVFEIP